MKAGLLQGGERERLCRDKPCDFIRLHSSSFRCRKQFFQLSRHPPAAPPAAPSAPAPSRTQGAGAAPPVPAAPALAKSELRAEKAAVSGGPAGIVRLNRPPPPPEPKRPPPPAAWVDKKLAAVMAEVWLTEEKSELRRLVPVLVPVLVRSAGAAKVKVLGDGGGVWPMTGGGDAGGGAGVEAPVSARHVDPKTNPPALAAATENLRGTEVVGGGVPVGTSGAAPLVLPLLRAFTILRLRSSSVAAFVKVPAVLSTFSLCMPLLADIRSRSDSRMRLVRATSGCSSVPCTLV